MSERESGRERPVSSGMRGAFGSEADYRHYLTGEVATPAREQGPTPEDPRGLMRAARDESPGTALPRDEKTGRFLPRERAG